MRTTIYRGLFIGSPAVLTLTFAAAPAGAVAVITFSGLNNGVNSATDPDNTSTGTAIPSTYQPLQNAYPAPGGGTDGANLGVGITWDKAFVAAKASNGGVNEHTHMVTPTDTANVNLYDNGSNPITMTFSTQVAVPSFYYAFFGAGSYTLTFSGYTNATDTTPAVTLNENDPNTGAYAWIQETGFGNTPLQKITFSRSAQYLQLDDITVNAVPEPTALGLLGVGGLLLSRRPKRR